MVKPSLNAARRSAEICKLSLDSNFFSLLPALDVALSRDPSRAKRLWFLVVGCKVDISDIDLSVGVKSKGVAMFAFSFSGDDIEDEGQGDSKPTEQQHQQPPPAAPASAFPVAGKPLLPATRHDLKQMLSQLPSKIAYSTLDVDLDGKGSIQLPRRELWDVRVQLMAEGEDGGGGETEPGLGNHDVKTGVYEGGFKSWESSVDLVKVLAQSNSFLLSQDAAPCVVELGCGTGLPTLALFKWATAMRIVEEGSSPVTFMLADYNPTVLQLVTLPNLILSWALQESENSPLLVDALSSEGELELSPEVIQAFDDFLSARKTTLKFFSGGWSSEFVHLIQTSQSPVMASGSRQRTVILGAETIYSPFALESFTETIFSLMNEGRSRGDATEVLVGAKRLYFGVGGSLDDFITRARERGANVEQVREEADGVRRGVVRCALPP